MKKIIVFIALLWFITTSLNAQLPKYCVTVQKVSETANTLTVKFYLTSVYGSAVNADVAIIVNGGGGISGSNIIAGNGNVGMGQSFQIYNPTQNPAGTYAYNIISAGTASFDLDESSIDGLGVYIPDKIGIEVGCTINSLTVLPLELKTFTAKKEENNALLSWQTASEKNVSHFEVERSKEGSSFLPIGFVKAVGNSNKIEDYALVDEATLNGINYYRLKMVDIDGKNQYSKVVSLEFSKKISAKTFPNPCTTELTLELDIDRKGGNVIVEIFDALGKQIFQKKVQAATDDLKIALPVTELATGSYILRAKDGKDTWQQKITKQ